MCKGGWGVTGKRVFNLDYCYCYLLNRLNNAGFYNPLPTPSSPFTQIYTKKKHTHAHTHTHTHAHRAEACKYPGFLPMSCFSEAAVYTACESVPLD